MAHLDAHGHPVIPKNESMWPFCSFTFFCISGQRAGKSSRHRWMWFFPAACGKMCGGNIGKVFAGSNWQCPRLLCYSPGVCKTDPSSFSHSHQPTEVHWVSMWGSDDWESLTIITVACCCVLFRTSLPVKNEKTTFFVKRERRPRYKVWAESQEKFGLQTFIKTTT